MKAFTKRYENDSIVKYPIVSKKTGKKYLVVIQQYYFNDEYYEKGCIVRLYDGKLRFGIFPGKQLMEIYLENENGKIMHSDFPYNLIGLSEYVVTYYEAKQEKEEETIRTLEKDFEEFKKWDGVV